VAAKVLRDKYLNLQPEYGFSVIRYGGSAPLQNVSESCLNARRQTRPCGSSERKTIPPYVLGFSLHVLKPAVIVGPPFLCVPQLG